MRAPTRASGDPSHRRCPAVRVGVPPSPQDCRGRNGSHSSAVRPIAGRRRPQRELCYPSITPRARRHRFESSRPMAGGRERCRPRGRHSPVHESRPDARVVDHLARRRSARGSPRRVAELLLRPRRARRAVRRRGAVRRYPDGVRDERRVADAIRRGGPRRTIRGYRGSRPQTPRSACTCPRWPRGPAPIAPSQSA